METKRHNLIYLLFLLISWWIAAFVSEFAWFVIIGEYLSNLIYELAEYLHNLGWAYSSGGRFGLVGHYYWPHHHDIEYPNTIFFAEAALVGIVYTFSFLLTVFVYSRFGHPKYWSDIKTQPGHRRFLARIWITCAWKSLPVFPCVSFVWLVFTQLFMAQLITGTYFIDLGWRSWILSLLSLVLIYFWIISRTLRRYVLESIPSKRQRCVKCDYIISHIDSPRCPECGTLIVEEKASHFGLFRPKSVVNRVILSTLKIFLLLYMLSAPIATLLTRAYTPLKIQIALQMSVPTRTANWPKNSFAISVDDVCIIRKNNKVGLVWFSCCPEYSAWKYHSAFWDDESQASKDNLGKVKQGITARYFGMDPTFVGPWTLKCVPATQEKGWFCRPDDSYQVEIVKSLNEAFEYLANISDKAKTSLYITP